MKMKIVAVKESKRWRNTKTGATASLFGACPWSSEAERSAWALEVVGWTWELANGTVGLGRAPAKTKQEAEEVMARHNAR